MLNKRSEVAGPLSAIKREDDPEDDRSPDIKREDDPEDDRSPDGPPIPNPINPLEIVPETTLG